MTNESSHTDVPGLDAFHHELGSAAFEAFQADEIVEHSLFADRIEVENLIDQLQAEIHADDSSSLGFLAAAKAKAKKAANYLKIQQARFRLKGFETDIGRRLIEANTEEQVRCEATAEILDQIAVVKSEIRSGVYIDSEQLSQLRPDLLIADDEEILLFQPTGLIAEGGLVGSPTVFLLVTDKHLRAIARDRNGKIHRILRNLTECSGVEYNPTDDGGCVVRFIFETAVDEVLFNENVNCDRIAIVTKRLSAIAEANAPMITVREEREYPLVATVAHQDEGRDLSPGQSAAEAPDILEADAEQAEYLNSLRNSPKIRFRQYSDAAFEPDWLAREARGFFTSQAWRAAEVQIYHASDIYAVCSAPYVVLIATDGTTLYTGVVHVNEIGLTNIAGAGVLGAMTFGVGFIAMGAMSAGKLLQNKRQASIVEFIDQRVGMKQLSPPAEVVPQQKLEENIPDKIKSLAMLHESGVLTDEEFAAKKSDLLARM